MIVDAHQHFWLYDPLRDSWITPEMGAIRRDFLPADLAKELNANKVDGCIAVQADQTETETEFLLQLAEANTFIKGVVGWVDLRAKNLYDRLDFYSQFEKIKGFRHIIQAEPVGFMLDPEFIKGVSQLSAFDFTFDLLIYEHQLTEAADFVAKLPNVSMVLDHLAKPPIGKNNLTRWRAGVKKLATFPNLSCKLSGLVTEASWGKWSEADFRPAQDTALEAFGASRLMFGSDWPVGLLSGTYEKIKDLTVNYIRDLSTDEQNMIMGLNALKFYQLEA